MEMLAVLDLYQRRRAGKPFLTGRFGGIVLEIHRIAGRSENDPAWRLYARQHVTGLEKDLRARTAATRPLSASPAPLPASLVGALSVAGIASRFEREDED